MIVERNMIHEVVDLIPDSEMPKVYAILNAFLSIDTEETLSEEEETIITKGFQQVTNGDYMTLEAYRKKRELV